jgi:hypothetical protein
VSGEDKATSASSPDAVEEAKRTTVSLRYGGASQLVAEGGGVTLALFGEVQRADVRGGGTLADPLLAREALSALHDVVKSDFRYIPKDRTAYLAYRRMKQQQAGMSLWEAQRAYVDWLARNDPMAFMILDPIVSVHPDELLFEVFSKDEGSYAKLGIDWSSVSAQNERSFGTTNIDFTDALLGGVERMRSYRETKISVGREAVKLATTEAGGAAHEVLEKKINVPDTWIRGFLQVQSAGTLPRTVVTLAPMDLYNLLRHLRMNADPKKGGRGVRVELVPGEPPRLVVEPWEVVITTTHGPYTGRTPQVVRIWGRRRLMLLKRMLPFVQSVDLHLLGSGLPSFWVLRAGAVTFTLGLSGFTSSNWAQAVSFDLLLPRKAADPGAYDKVLKYLEKHWVASAEDIAKGTKLEAARVLEALQVGSQRGQLMFDLAKGVYRFRPLVGQPLDPGRFEFRNDRERVAHDLVADKGAVKIVSENRIHDVGLELVGKVAVAADKREYRPSLLIDDDGRVKKADCTCAFFKKHQLKEGPCEHLVALRLAEAREEARRKAQRGAARGSITIETRTYAKRNPKGEDVYQVALDRRRVKIRWGQRGGAERLQSLVFNSVEEAQAAYFARVDDLERRGFLDATAS